MKNTALLLIDIQNDYFPKGKYDLVGMTSAAKNAAKISSLFRSKALPIYHVRHEIEEENPPFFERGTIGAQIHESVKPEGDEAVVLKHEANSFIGTHLHDLLKRDEIKHLVVCGAMSHMCIDSTVRGACDLGFECTVIHDACATHDMEFNSIELPAAQVHAVIMASLDQDFAEMVSTKEMAKKLAAIKIDDAA